MSSLRILLSGIALIAAIAVMFAVNSQDSESENFTPATATADTQAAAAVADDPPAVGDVAPGFTLFSNEGTEVSLGAYEGQWVVLYFYPRNFTSGCTIEAKKFEMDQDKYTDRNAVILGVSTDSVESHEEFCTKEGLSFKLLADVDGQVSNRYGSLRDGSDRLTSKRNTFVINPTGVVSEVFIGVDPNTHSEQVLEALDDLQAG